MFKNRDGSYNKGSIIISLFILLVTFVMIFSYIGANVTLPTINLTQDNSIKTSPAIQIPTTQAYVLNTSSSFNYTNTTPFNLSYTNYTKTQWVDINSSVTIVKFNTTGSQTWIRPNNTSTINYILVGNSSNPVSNIIYGGGGGGYTTTNYMVGAGGGAGSYGSAQTNYTPTETTITTPVTFPSLVQTSPLDSIFSTTMQTIMFFGWVWIVFRLLNK